MGNFQHKKEGFIVKRVLAFVLAVIMCLSFVGCNNIVDNINCPNCGESVSDEASFCSKCGTALESSSPASSDSENSSEITNSSNSETGSENVDSSEPDNSSEPAETSKPTTSSKPADTSKPTSSTESSKPTTSSKPTENTNSSTTPSSTTETEECRHLNAFNAPNEDADHPIPTCTEGGYCFKYCPDCYMGWYEEAEAFGHKTSASSIGYVAPTCCTEGQKGAKEYCYVCKTIIKEGDILPKVYYNHIGETYKINEVEQTWSQTGYSGDTCCDGCKDNIFPENKGSTIPAEKDCPWSTKSYSAEKDKLKCECSMHSNYLEYIDLDPISIREVSVIRVLNLSGDGVKCVKFFVSGGSLSYTVEYEIISDLQYVPGKFGDVVNNNDGSYSINLVEASGHWIPDGTKIKIKITDSSGRTYDNTYTVIRHAWNDYEVI